MFDFSFKGRNTTLNAPLVNDLQHSHAARAMFEATADKSANVVRLRYSGSVAAHEVKRCCEQLEILLPDLQSGFRLLTDISRLEIMDMDAVPYIERMMDLCAAKGVAMVVRVIPDPHKDIGLNIMSLFHYKRNVRILTCITLDQAERALA